MSAAVLNGDEFANDTFWRDRNHKRASEELNIDTYLAQLAMLPITAGIPESVASDFTLAAGLAEKSILNPTNRKAALMKTSMPVGSSQARRQPAENDTVSPPMSVQKKAEGDARINSSRVPMLTNVTPTSAMSTSDAQQNTAALYGTSPMAENAADTTNRGVSGLGKTGEDEGKAFLVKGEEKSPTSLTSLLQNLSSNGDKRIAGLADSRHLRPVKAMSDKITHAYQQITDRHGTVEAGETRMNFTFRRWGEGTIHSVKISMQQTGTLPAVIVPSDPLVSQRLSASLVMPDAPTLLMRDEQGEQHQQRQHSRQDIVEDEDA